MRRQGIFGATILAAILLLSMGQVSNPTRILVQDEGTNAGRVNTLNITGAAATATVSGTTATIDVTGGSGVSDATYITQTAHADLSAEQALSSLSTGIVKVTTGTGVLSTAVAGDFPTLNQNTTGTASNVTGVVAAANGGTAQSTYAQGDLLYASAANTLSKLAKGTSGQFLKIGATVPAWGDTGGIVTGTCGSAGGWSPADATTYDMMRYAIFDCSNAAAGGYGIQYLVAPFAMEITFVQVRVIIAPTVGSAGDVTFYVRVNDTTNNLLGTMAWTAAGVNATFTPAAIALAANDTWTVRMVTPTWATNPSFVYVAAEVGYRVR